jgi:polyisoprenoid-binding protein YceI
LRKTVVLVSAGLLLTLPTHAVTLDAVQPEKSKVGFNFKQMGVAMDGHFAKSSAALNFDPAKPEQAKATIEVDLASIDTGTDEVDQEVVGKAWFNTAAFPKAVFVAKQVKQIVPNQYEVLGSLSIKGRSRDVKSVVKLSPQGKSSVLSGSFTLQRADFAIGEGMWSKFDVVANDIQVNFQFTAFNAATGK